MPLTGARFSFTHMWSLVYSSTHTRVATDRCKLSTLLNTSIAAAVRYEGYKFVSVWGAARDALCNNPLQKWRC